MSIAVLKSWRLTLLLLTPCACVRVSTDETVHYSFRYQDCVAGLMEDTVSLTQYTTAFNNRKLRTGSGLSCMDGHLGVQMSYPTSCDANDQIPAITCPASAPDPTCPYMPAISNGQPGDFRAGLSAGFTIEAWLRPDPIDVTSSSKARVIASLSSGCPVTPTGDADDECKEGKHTSSADAGSSISFRLMQTEDGCVAFEFKTQPEDGETEANCLVIPAINADCDAGYGLDMSSTAPQHVVITVNQDLDTVPSTGGRVVTYINKVDVTNTDGGFADSRDVSAYSAALNTQASSNQDFESLWNSQHYLHFGMDGYGSFDGRLPWGGELYMFAMYGRPLTASEVEQNYDSGLDNSAPVASGLTYNVTEDTCTQLPSLLGAETVTDWDRDGSQARAQTLTATLTALPTCAGTAVTGCGKLYSDNACSTLVAEADLPSLDPASLYFQAEPDDWTYRAGTETTAGGLYSTIEWSVDDGAGGTDSATLTLRVDAVNDAPVAWNSKLSAYMDIPTPFNVNGTDVDGPNAVKIDTCSLRITIKPTNGVLRAIQPGGTLGPILDVGDVVNNITLYYHSNRFEGTAGQRIVATDLFSFELTDAEGLTSASPASVSIDILSGLDSISESNTAEEETLKVITLRGINQRPGLTWFTVTSLPSHGTLFQYPPPPGSAATVTRGLELLAAPANLSDASISACSAPYVGWLCATVAYEGDLDFFSFPTVTRDGVDLNVTDDSFQWVVESSSETSAVATSTVRVNNVNDLCELVAPNNVTFAWSANPGERWASVAAGVTIVDRDRGVGFYQIGVRSNKGTLKELAHRQPAAGGGLVADTDKWQWSTDAIQNLLGYCPPACSDSSGRCRGTLCIEGKDGSLEPTLRVFATPKTAQTFLEALLYSGDDKIGQKLFIEVDDFDSQVAPPIPPPPGRSPPSPASAELQLLPESTCSSSFIGGGCDGEGLVSQGACGSGLITTGAGWGAIASIVIVWLIVCCRQRGRTGLRDYRGRLKRKKDRPTSDQRCWVPLLATIAMFLTLGAFAGRSKGSFHALVKMDFEGDGYCGPDATEYGYTLDTPGGGSSPSNASEGSDTSPAAPAAPASNASRRLSESSSNASQSYTDIAEGAGAAAFAQLDALDTSVGWDNLGCTGGVPQGFMPDRSLGDMLVVGLVGPILLIEVSGRGKCGRTMSVLVSSLILLAAVLKFGVFKAWFDQIPEAKACPDCPSFITVHHESPADGPPMYALGPCCNNAEACDIRPFQNNFVLVVLLGISLPPALVLFLIAVCAVLCKAKKGEEDEEDEEDEDSDSEEERHKHHKHGKHGKHDHHHHGKEHKSKTKKHGKKKHDSDSEDESEEEERRHTKKNGHGGDHKSNPNGRKPRPAGKPPPPSHPHPDDVEKANGDRGSLAAPKVPKAAMQKKIGMGKPSKASTAAEFDSIDVESADAGGPRTSMPPPPPRAKPAPPPPKPKAPPPIEWYYMDFDDVQQGPVNEAAMHSLYNMGDIHDFTSVWNEGMAEWSVLRDHPKLVPQ